VKLRAAACALALAACATPAHGILSGMSPEDRSRFWRCEPYSWEACQRDQECGADPEARQRGGEMMARLYADAPDEAARRKVLEEMGCPAEVIERGSFHR
jgi:hypothetical protein